MATLQVIEDIVLSMEGFDVTLTGSDGTWKTLGAVDFALVAVEASFVAKSGVLAVGNSAEIRFGVLLFDVFL
jgi:hypothetical protein